MRPLKMTDVAELTPIFTDPDVMRFIGGAYDLEGVEIQLKDWIANYKKDGFGFMAFIDKKDNKLIGYGGFLRQAIEGTAYIELGYCFTKSYWGKGFATEAASALKEYGLTILQLPEIISIIHEDNIASLHVAKNIGMSLLKKAIIDGNNCYIYYLLAAKKNN